MIITLLLIMAAAYFAGGLLRGIVVLVECFTVIYLFEHLNWLELLLAAVVAWLLASKGVLTVADDTTQPPAPPTNP